MLLSCTRLRSAVRCTYAQNLPSYRCSPPYHQQYVSQTFQPASIAPALQDLVTTGRLKADDSQHFAAQVLNALQTAVKHEAQSVSPQTTSVKAETAAAQLANQAPSSLAKAHLYLLPRGAYLWGTIGSGKTMLLDLFCSTFLESDRQQLGLCRRHFHDFMLTIHSRLHSLQESVPRVQGRSQFGLPVYRSATRQNICCGLCVCRMQHERRCRCSHPPWGIEPKYVCADMRLCMAIQWILLPRALQKIPKSCAWMKCMSLM